MYREHSTFTKGLSVDSFFLKKLKKKVSEDYIITMLYYPTIIIKMQLLLISLVLGLFSVTSGSPVKCIEGAPYNLHQTPTVLAINEAARQAMGFYEYRLATLIENLSTLPPSQVDAALDLFMEVFCEPPYFKGFIGITGDGTLFTNLTVIRELYRMTALAPGVHVPFNVKIYNIIPSINPAAQTDHNSVYVNITAFNEHVIRVTGMPPTLFQGLRQKLNDVKLDDVNFLLVNGHYQNEFRIDENSNICISGFFDDFRIINQLPHTNLLALPWDLPILDLP